MSLIVARELDRNKFDISHGTYDYLQLIQQTGGQTAAAVITSAGAQSIFEFPPGVYNLSKSILNYINTPTAGVAYNLTFADTVAEIQQLYLYTRTNVQMCYLQQANNYVNAVLRHESKLTVVEDNDIAYDGVGFWQGLEQPSVTITGAAQAGVPTVMNQNVPPTSIDAAPVFLPSLETPIYAIGGGNASNTPVLARQFEMGKVLPGTIFAVDQDIYFPETVYMKIIWENPNRIYYNVTALSNSSTGAAAGTSWSYSNLSVYAAVEKNPVICNDLAAAASRGELKYLIPYVYTDLINIPSGTQQSIQTRYNRGHGSKLQKIYWAPYNNTTIAKLAYDHSNINGSKVSSFYTTVNNVRTNTFDYVIDNGANMVGDDYNINKKILAGSAITNSQDYYTNFTWIENFCNNYSQIDRPLMPPEQNYVDGLDLTAEKIYNIKATTTNAAYNHYVFAVCQRELSIQPGMITVG